MSGPLIAAFDIATTTGLCFGAPGGRPTLTTWDLRPAGDRPRRLAHFHCLCTEFFRLYKIDKVRYESPLNLRAMFGSGTSEQVMLMLRGAIGVLECAAAQAGIDDIGSFNVQDARQHLTGFRTFPKVKGKSTAKAQIMKMCKTLGIDAKTEDSADAYAGWSYCCALANPRLAHLTSPLFSR